MKSKVLLIAPDYFGYHLLILDELKHLGYEVEFIFDHNSGFLFNLCNRTKWSLKLYTRFYFKQVKGKCYGQHYKFLIVIGGKTLQNEQWQEFFTQVSCSRKIMYQWDSVNNYDYRKNIRFYDNVLTFDRKDAEELGIGYLPLFFKRNDVNHNKIDIDLLFLGIWHSDRIDILSEIYKQATEHHLKCVFKVYYPYYLYLWLRYIKGLPIKSSFWIFRKLPAHKVQRLYQCSKCIVDVNHPRQVGLTMRTIETVGLGKKLITTNPNVVYESFYTSDNIQIIDRKNIQVDFSFLEKESQYQNIGKYELSNWILTLLNEKDSADL